jgi:hypothetical protein
MSNGRYRMNWVPCGDTTEECLVQTGGIAGEVIICNTWDNEGCAHDEKRIAELGGKAIADHLSNAISILDQYRELFTKELKHIRLKCIEARGEAQFDDDADSYQVFSLPEIEQVRQEMRSIRSDTAD